MSLIFRMVFLATALPVFSFNARADSAERATNQSAVAGGDRDRLKETKSSAWRQQSVRRIIRSLRELGYFST